MPPTVAAPDKYKDETIPLSDEERVKQVVVESVFGLWNVVNNLTRLRPTRRERYRVTIFGSARAKPGSFPYEETKRVAAALAVMGCDVITGGGPGLMQAANEGAASVAAAPDHGRSIGIRVDLPFEQEVNAYVGEAYEHRNFFSRLHQFALASDAYIVAPGGIGSVLETAMIWQLLQVHHLPRETPLILVGPMWKGLVAWTKESMLNFDPPLASADDLAIPHCAANADEAIAHLRVHHDRWRAEAKA